MIRLTSLLILFNHVFFDYPIEYSKLDGRGKPFGSIFGPRDLLCQRYVVFYNSFSLVIQAFEGSKVCSTVVLVW